MSRTQNASRNIWWGILNRIIMILLPFAIRTVMIYSMGMQYVGLGSLFSSILQVLSFAELGIGGALVFSMYKPIAEDDDAKVGALLNFYRKTYKVIGLVILIIGFLIMPFLRKLIEGDVPKDINLYLLFLVYLLNNVLGYFMYAYKQSLFMASQRIDIISKIGMLLQLLSGIVQIIILLTTHNYYLYVIVVPIITVLNNICIGVCADKAFPQYKCEGELAKNEVDDIKKKVAGMFFQKVGGIVLRSVDTIVISMCLGLVSLALFENYNYIITSLTAFMTVITQSMISAVGNSVVVTSVEKNYRDFKVFNFAYVWISGWCAICLLCLYQPFMEIWVKKDNMLGMDMVILFAICFFVNRWCDMLYVYQEACGIWWEARFVPMIAALVNLSINIVLVQFIGLPGILISTIISVVFVYAIGYSKVLFNTYFKPMNGLRQYWIKQCLFLCTIFVVAAVTYVICNEAVVSNIVIKLVLNGVICVIVPNVALSLIWRNTSEFGKVKELVKEIIKRNV